MAKEISLIIGGILRSHYELPDSVNIDIYEQVKIVEAGQLAVQLEKNGVQAIISTGGTASEIARHVKIPVIDASVTYFDLLETLKLLEDEGKIIGENVAIVLYTTRNIDIERLQPFLRNKLTIFKYKTEEELRQVVFMLSQKEYRVVVGGFSTIALATPLGIYGHPLYLGRETLHTAYEKAMTVIKTLKKEREESYRLHTVLELFHDGVLITDDKGIITVCNPKGLDIIGLEADQVIGKKVYQVTRDASWLDVYQKGLSQFDSIIELKSKKMFSTRRPIILQNKIIGAVGTFQEIDKIQKLEHAYRKLQTLGLTANYHFKDIIGSSEILKKTIEQAKAYAKVDSTILITGETGTGKELFAQSIHNLSSRRHGPFVAINCAALPESLLESELLGYEEGAFTGARKGGKAGLFELAHKGTIFLDEINQLPIALQGRILRVIQERQVFRLGGEKIVPVDVRIISATNEDLEHKVDTGGFRDDLYFRLSVLSLRLPPLRERIEDIPILAEFFLNIFRSAHGNIKSFSQESIKLMMEYTWPGNVRELLNFVERFAVVSGQQLISDIAFTREYIFRKDQKPTNTVNDSNTLQITLDTLKNMEEQIFHQVLQRVSGNKMQAALMLGIGRTTLWKKLNKKKI